MKLNKIATFTSLLLLLGVSLTYAAKDTKEKITEVHKISIVHYSGAITAAAADYFSKSFNEASSENGADLVIIALDTPGGLDSSMRVIIKGLMNLGKPAVVFVSPKGARAASAGVFITLSAPIAAMAPGTNIGAAHPVFLGGFPTGNGDKKGNKAEGSIMEDKVLNDSVAYIQSLAAKTGRNVDWAMQAVKKSVSVSAEEAIRLGLIDFIAEDMSDFIRKIDGRYAGDFGKLKLVNPVIEHRRQGPRERFLATIATPDLAMLLAGVGAAGLFIEMYNPGLVLPGVLGAMSLVLSLYSFQTLSATGAGLALLLLAFVFFIAEIKIMSYGLLTIAGALSMLIGGLMLFEPQASGGLNISANIFLSTIICLIAVVAILAYIVYNAQVRKVVVGIESLAEKIGLAKTKLNPKGKVLVEGELWEAESISGSIEIGEKIVVTEVSGFVIKVRKYSANKQSGQMEK